MAHYNWTYCSIKIQQCHLQFKIWSALANRHNVKPSIFFSASMWIGFMVYSDKVHQSKHTIISPEPWKYLYSWKFINLLFHPEILLNKSCLHFSWGSYFHVFFFASFNILLINCWNLGNTQLVNSVWPKLEKKTEANVKMNQNCML